MIMFDNSDLMPFGKRHEIQITDKELYAFEPLLHDAVCHYGNKIADLRKKLGIPSEYPDTLLMLSEIQQLEGKIFILKDILQQIECL